MRGSSNFLLALVLAVGLSAPASAQTVVPSNPVAPPVPPASEVDCATQPALCLSDKPKSSTPPDAAAQPIPPVSQVDCAAQPALCLGDKPKSTTPPGAAPQPIPPVSEVDCAAQPGLCFGDKSSGPPDAPPVPGVSEPDCVAQPFLCENGKPKAPATPAPNPNLPPECQPKVNDPLSPLLPQCNQADTSAKPEYCQTSPNAGLLFPECATPNGMAVPAPPSEDDPCETTGATGIDQGLGACSPMCRDVSNLNESTRDACRLSGSIAHLYPVRNYGLDVNLAAALTNPLSLIPAAFQGLAALIWQIFIRIFDGVLLMLAWAFSLDLLGNVEIMERLHDGLVTFHERVFGSGWTLAALSLAALWGLWHGLVRAKTIETIAGLGGTLGLMVIALLVIYRPDATVAPLSSLANEGSMQVLSGISTASVDNPDQALANTQQGIFNAVILRAWCALQFGDIEYCLAQRLQNGRVRARMAGELSVADVWLKHAPNAPDREALYRITAGKSRPAEEIVPPITLCPEPGGSWARGDTGLTDAQEQKVEEWAERLGGRHTFLIFDFTADSYYDRVCDHLRRNPELFGNPDKTVVWPQPDKTVLQEESGTLERIALLAIVLVGLAGAVLLFGWIAVRLVLASVFSLMYILMTPVLLLIAACGNAGRASVVGAGKRALGQIIAKFVFALLLALAVLEANILASLKLGFYATWLLQSAFWWGFFVKRHDFLGFLSLDERAPLTGGLGLSSNRSGFGFMNLYYGARVAGNVAGAVTRAATAAPRAGIRRLRRAHLGRIDADSGAIREQAHSELGLRARREAQIAHNERLAEPRRVVAEDAQRRSRLAQLNRDLKANPRDRATRQARDALQRKLKSTSGAVRTAQGQIDRAGNPRELSERDVNQWIERRGRDVMGRPPEADENLRAAGISPAVYANASPQHQDAMRAQSARIMARDRRLMQRIGDPRDAGPGQAPLSRDERREAFRESVPQGTFGDLSERARAIRRDADARERFEHRRERTRRGRRHVR